MKKFVIVPTYNESLNIERLLDGIFSQPIEDLHALVVDDNSPDGTSRKVEALKAKHPRLWLVERLDEKGRGSAGVTGFEIAMQLGADAIVEMDADFSHPPTDLPRLFAALEHADIAIASRLAAGAMDTRPAPRRFITLLANAYTRALLQRPGHRSRVQDWTTGFRAYKRRVFEAIPPASLISQGPSILQEILLRALNAGMTATEIPFRMVDREAGASTFSRKVAVQSLLSIPAYRILFGPRHRSLRLAPTAAAAGGGDRHIVLRLAQRVAP